MAKKSTISKNLISASQTNKEESDIVKVNPEWVAEKISPYLLAYPGESVFFIASDGQVFLETSKNDAINHQHRIDKEQSFITYTRTNDEITERQDQ